MKYLKQSIYRLIGLFLAFFPLLAFADSYKWSGLTSVFAPEPSDSSMAFLAQIFGGAGGGLAAGGSSIMGEIFGVFNSGLLTITGLVLVYVTLRSITDTAMDGEAMGKKLNHWMAIRVAAGIGLLVPKATGYSILNSIVIWATVQGVGFADTVWKHSLEYLANGGVIYRSVSSATNLDNATGILDGRLLVGDRFIPGSPPTVADKESAAGKAAGASDIFRSLVCMHAVEEGIRKARKQALDDVKKDYTDRKYYPKKRDKDGDARYNQLVSYLQNDIVLHPFFESSYDATAKTAIAQVSIPGNELKNPPQFPKDNYYYLGSQNDKLLRSCCVADPLSGDHDCSSCFTQTPSFGDTKGICGVFSVTVPGTILQHDYDVYVAAKYAGLQQMVDDLDSAAKEFVTRQTEVKAASDTPCVKNDGTVNPNQCFSQEYTDSLANAVINAGGEYQAAIEPARIMCGNSEEGQVHCTMSYGDDSTDKRNFAKATINGKANPNYAGQYGWLAAGRYYFDIANLVDNAIKWDKTGYIITVITPAPHVLRDLTQSDQGRYQVLKEKYMEPFVGGIAEDIGNLKLRLLWVIKGKNLPGDDVIGVEPQAMNFMDKINTTLAGSTHKPDDLPFNTRTHVSSFIGIGDRIVLEPLSSTLDDVYTYWKNDLRSSTGFPLLNIHTLGMHVMGSVADCYNTIFNGLRGQMIAFYVKEMAFNAASMSGSFTSYFAPFGAGGTFNPTMIFQAILNMINVTIQFFLVIPMMIALPLAISILTPLFATGITLAYYVPLIPFMLFTFGTITWLISVIEAMAAAPIIALGITHPEGHDLLGKAEQALMLLFSVFLRPVTMIIGLVASLILSYVALNVLNSGFDHVIGALGAFAINDMNSIASSYLAAVVGMTVLLIYLFTVLALMNQCFALIHVIPEKMMRWLGMHPETGPEQQLAESVKAGAGQFGDAASRGVGEAGGKIGSGAGESASTKAFGGSKREPPKPPSVGAAAPP